MHCLLVGSKLILVDEVPKVATYYVITAIHMCIPLMYDQTKELVQQK